MHKLEGSEKTNKYSKLLFIIELMLAIFIAIGAGFLGMSNLLFEPEKIPAAANINFHLSRVIFITQQFQQGQFSAAFPFWFDFTTGKGFYSTLSYDLLALIYWATDNIRNTFQVFYVAFISVGGLGIWLLCYRKVGRWIRLFGILLYCLSPFLLETLYIQGDITQALVFALIPWFLVCFQSLAVNPTRRAFSGSVLFLLLILLTDFRYAVIIACFSVILLFLVGIARRSYSKSFIVCILSVLFSIGLASFAILKMQLSEIRNLPSYNLEFQDRVINVMVIAGIIAFILLAHWLWSLKRGQILFKTITLLLLGSVCYFLNPFAHTYEVNRADTIKTDIQKTKYQFDMDTRNSLVISSQKGFSKQFPFFVEGKSKNLWDYSEQELLLYKVIYIIEPSINTRSQKEMFENMVARLTDAGVQIIIEPVESKNFEVFDVHVEDEAIDASPILSTTEDFNSPSKSYIIKYNSYLRSMRSLYGLDNVYATMLLNQGNIKNIILGTKKIDNHEVLFVGAHLSQYLKSIYVLNNGTQAANQIVNKNSENIESVFRTIFKQYNVNMDDYPQDFNSVSEQNWNLNGGSFSYQSGDAQTITIPIQYSQRLQAKLDGKRISLFESEDKIRMQLPAGEHEVVISYDRTQTDRIAEIVSIATFGLLLLLLLLWKWILQYLVQKTNSFLIYLQLYNPKKEEKSIEDNCLEQEQYAYDEVAAGLQEVEEETPLPELQTTEVEQLNLPEQGKKYQGHIIEETHNENGITVNIVIFDDEGNLNELQEPNEDLDVIPTKDTIDQNERDEVDELLKEAIQIQTMEDKNKSVSKNSNPQMTKNSSDLNHRQRTSGTGVKSKSLVKGKSAVKSKSVVKSTRDFTSVHKKSKSTRKQNHHSKNRYIKLTPKEK